MIDQGLREKIEREELSADAVFSILESASRFWMNGERKDADDVEIVIRLLERADQYEEHLQGARSVVNALARQAGLFPYYQHSDDLNDDLAFEAHRAPSLPNIYFHSAQREVFTLLEEGKNVVLSAPTSFGKTLLVDALIASRAPQVVIIVVPTIALLEERRRRLTRLFPNYQVISQAFQDIREENFIIIGTQERILERQDLPDPDLFVIDEFYKLDLTSGDLRAKSLNLLLARFIDTAKQVYLLGPSIDTNPVDEAARPSVQFVKTDYSPVTANFIQVDPPGTDPDTLFEVLSGIRGESSLVYCRSPKSARTASKELVQRGYSHGSKTLAQIAEWLRENYHEEWYLADALENGIGIHHGRIPRAIAFLMVQLFNNGDLKVLLCTSTLIEGVNTAAKNVLIYDKFISTKKLDRFTFNNIKGRAGRMFRHFIGNVYLFNADQPTASDQLDIPILQNADALPDQTIVQLPERVLSQANRERKRGVLDRTPVPEHILERFAKFGITELEAIFDTVIDMFESDDTRLLWDGLGRYNEILASMEMVWGKIDFNKHDVFSAPQFALLANRLCKSASISEFIYSATSGDSQFGDIDTQIDRAFSFLRGAEYSFIEPLQLVQDMTNGVYGAASCDYSKFLGDLSSWGLPGKLKALEELGVPAPITQSLVDILDPEDVDTSLDRIRALLPNDGAMRDTDQLILSYTLGQQ